MKNGLTHNDRYLKELDASYFKVDERSLSDFIDFTVKFSKLIAFYDAKNDLEGDASQILENDITVLLVQISALDIDTIETKFERLVISFLAKHGDVKNDMFASARSLLRAMRAKKDSIEELMTYLFELHQTIESWNLKTVEEVEYNNEIKKLIETKFSKTLSRLMAFDRMLIAGDHLEPKTRIINYLEKNEWKPEEYVYPENFFDPSKNINSTIADEFYNIFNSIIYSVRPIVKSAKKYSQYYLADGNTRPHVALFIAFIELFKNAQYDINNFTQRHLDYFYEEILLFKKRKEIADQVFVTFTVQDSVEVCKIPEKSRLLAGQDSEGNDLIYELDSELVVTKSNISFRRAIVNDLKATGGAEKNFEYAPINIAVNKSNYEEKIGPENYYLGLAFASSFLKLSEGDRTIQITLELQRYSFDNFMKLFNTEVQNNIELNVHNMDEFAANLFNFAYSTTTEDGEQEWFTISENKITTRFQKNIDGHSINRLDITVEIDTLSPPIDSCLSDKFPEAKTNQLPVCQLLINNSKLIYYNFFKVLIVEKINLSTGVNGIKELRLQNDYGMLDSSSPYEPFTATPTMGSTLYIGHDTIFSQHLDELQLVFDWSDVPLNANGFPEYYQGYSMVDSNEVFKASLSFLKNRKWYPEQNKQVISLFQDGEIDPSTGDVAVSSNTLVDTIDLKDINFHFSGPPVINTDETYQRRSKNGFLRLEFSSPHTAFGHKEYLDIIKNEASSMGKGGQMFIPNTPWTPTLRSLSVNYKSSIQIDIHNQEPLNKAYIYHVHPFGEKIVSEPVGHDIHLLPQYKKGSEIILGIKNFNEFETFSLFFQINEFTTDEEFENTDVQWSYLNKDKWHEIRFEQLVTDTTNDLSNSGIVVFDFASFDKELFNKESFLNNRSYPSGYFWLKCNSVYGEEFVQNINMVQCHAGVATYKNNGNAKDHLEKALPANAIESFVDDIPDINVIAQPFESVNGMPEESLKDFQTRVSERLNHKNRAITQWDFEHIILQEFQSIHKIICLNNLDSDLKQTPGNILIVVLPKVTAQDREAKVLEPSTTASKLQLLKEALEDKISPFVNIEVTNPSYEQVQVKCNVRFNKGLSERFYLQKLNEDLKDFLNPWDASDGQDLTLNNRIYAMHVIYFLETRPYLDYVTNLALFHIVDQHIYNIDTASDNNTVLEPVTDISVFVSADEHIIKTVGTQAEAEAIGAMMIGKDFSAEDVVEKEVIQGIDKDQIEISHQIDPEEEEIYDDTSFVFSFKNFFSEQ